jgi:hypothetical protein
MKVHLLGWFLVVLGETLGETFGDTLGDILGDTLGDILDKYGTILRE